MLGITQNQSPKIKFNKKRVNSAVGLNTNSAFVFVKHGYDPLNIKFNNAEIDKVKVLAEDNYLKEYNKSSNLIKQNTERKEEKEGVNPIKYKRVNVWQNKNEKIRSVSANPIRKDKVNYDSFFKDVSKQYVNDFSELIKENKQKAAISNKIVYSIKDGNIKKTNYNNYSDIFNMNKTMCNEGLLSKNKFDINKNIILMDETTTKQKSGESYCLLKQTPKLFCGTTLSNSELSQNSKGNSLINCSSVIHNPITPQIKNIATYRDNVINNYDPTTYPFIRSKPISGIIDLNRNGAPNHNKLFREELNKDKNVFNKKVSLCSNFYEIYGQYKRICNKPFMNKPE